jgi:hypothetical protein
MTLYQLLTSYSAQLKLFEKYKWQFKDTEVAMTYLKMHQGSSEENPEKASAVPVTRLTF